VVDLLDAAVAMLERSEVAGARALEKEADRLLDRTVGWTRCEAMREDVATTLEEAQSIHRRATSLVEGSRG
jgi:hypothetical protein